MSDKKMVLAKFDENYGCPKCGENENLGMRYGTYRPTPKDTAQEYLRVECYTCEYVYNMQTKDSITEVLPEAPETI